MSNTRTICSIFWDELKATRPYRALGGGGSNTTFFLPAVPPGAEPEMLVVADMLERQYFGDGRYKWVEDENGGTKAAVIAKDLVGEFSPSVPEEGGGRPGIWIAAGAAPSAEEKEDNYGNQVVLANGLCLKAGDDWINGRKTYVGRQAKKAAAWLGREYEWTRPAQPDKISRCPSCMADVRDGALWCGACRHVFDPERYKQVMEDRFKLEQEMAELRKKYGIAPALNTDTTAAAVPPPLSPKQPKGQPIGA